MRVLGEFLQLVLELPDARLRACAAGSDQDSSEKRPVADANPGNVLKRLVIETDVPAPSIVPRYLAHWERNWRQGVDCGPSF